MKNFKQILLPTFALFIICAVVSFALAGTNAITKDTIEQSQQKALEQSLISSVPSAERFETTITDKGNVYLSNESEIVLEIPFIVNTPGVAGFSIPDVEIIAVCADGSFSLLSGKGCDYSVVASGANEKFAVELGENDTAPEGGLYYLQMEATNLGDESGIIGIED